MLIAMTGFFDGTVGQRVLFVTNELLPVAVKMVETHIKNEYQDSSSVTKVGEEWTINDTNFELPEFIQLFEYEGITCQIMQDYK